jgi:hypothetical protein
MTLTTDRADAIRPEVAEAAEAVVVIIAGVEAVVQAAS